MIKNYENYELLNELGNGAQGKVFKVKNRDNDQYYAMKILINNEENEIIKLVEILSKIKHENIVRYYGYFIKNVQMSIIMEYCDYLDLTNFINMHKKKNILINQKIIYIISLDICEGLKEIHKNNIIHRDLKPENIFISKDYKIKR